MTSDVRTPHHPAPPRIVGAAVLAAAAMGLAGFGARAAEPNYPFEGSWVRANRICTSNAPHLRTYTAREVTFTSGHCVFRKVAAGSGQYEIFEDCRHTERPGDYTETIRMLGSDAMQVRRQAGRLKIAPALRFTRCSIAAPSAPKQPPPQHRSGTGEAPHPAEGHGARPAELKP